MKKEMTRRRFLSISAMSTAAVALDWRKIGAWAASAGPVAQYPAVVIGAGLGGLCCAAYLARQGFPVTLVEQHRMPGGYATAFDRKAGRYSFEVSLHGTSIHDNTPARILGNLGVLDDLDLVPLPEIYRLKTAERDIVVPQRDPEAYIRLLSEHFPHEADGIRGFVTDMIALWEEVERYGQESDFHRKYFKLLFPLQYRRMWQVRKQTLAEMMDAYVTDPEVQKVLGALWGYYGLPPSELSAFYYANATGGYLKQGSYTVRRRSQDLSDRLADAVTAAGGNVLYGTPVEKIELDSGRVSGVRLADGRMLPARVVVSNASATTTFDRMLPPGSLPPAYMKKIRSYRPSLSSFIVWLGIDRELRGRIPGFSTHVSTGESIEADYRACCDGDIEHGPFGVCLFDNLYDGYSAPGTSTVQLLFLCGYEPWRRFEAAYDAGDKAAYGIEKSRWRDVLIRRAGAAVIPGLTGMIEVAEAATPLTNRRYTGNPAGAIYGYAQTMDNAFMNRIDNRTPVKGLYLASAWGNPGGGFAGVIRAGESAFEKIMADLADIGAA